MRLHGLLRRLAVPALVIGMLLSGAGPAIGDAPEVTPRALPVVGFDFRVSGVPATADEWNPAVAYNPNTGQYLAVWEDYRNDAARSTDIYGRRLAADGSRIGGDFRISGPAATAGEDDPAVAFNPSTGQFLVVWVDGRNHATRSTDIYGQRVAANGSLVGSNFRIAGPKAVGQELSPALAYNSCTTQYLVVWQDRRNPLTRGYDVYGQRVASDGSRVAADFRISGSAATAGDWMPAVAYSTSANQYLVVWSDERNLTTRGYDIYGQRLAFDGSRVGGNFRISGARATGDERYPAVVHNGTVNQYLVVWSDGRSESTRDLDIYGQRVSAAGIGLGGNFRISGPEATAGERYPAVAVNPIAGRYLVVWQDGRREATRGQDIYGRKVAVDGSRIGADFRISGSAATADEWSPAVAYGSNVAEYLIVWSDGRRATTRGQDIYGRRVTG